MADILNGMIVGAMIWAAVASSYGVPTPSGRCCYIDPDTSIRYVLDQTTEGEIR